MQDFEIQPPNPMQQIMDIVDLAHQCLSMRKAYVNIDLFGGSDRVYATIITDFNVIEYAAIHSYYISPNANAWNESTRMDADMDNQQALQSIIDRLKEVLIS